MEPDAIKIQTYDENSMTIQSNKKILKLKKVCGKTILIGICIKAKTPYKWHKDIFAYAKKKRLFVLVHRLMLMQLFF